MNETATIYDQKDYYLKSVMPYVHEVIKLCKIARIPVFVTAAVANQDGKTTYVHDGVMTGSSEIELFDDQFERHLLVANGAELKPLVNDPILADAQAWEYIATPPQPVDDYVDELMPEEELEELPLPVGLMTAEEASKPKSEESKKVRTKASAKDSGEATKKATKKTRSGAQKQSK